MRYPETPLPFGQHSFVRLYRFGITPAQAQEYLGIPAQTVRNWFARGKFQRLEAAWIGKELKVLPVALERLQKQMERE